MNNRRIIAVHNRIVAMFIAAIVALSGVFTALSFEKDAVKDKNEVKKGFSIMSGYSKLSVKAGLTDYSSTAVYSGLDLTNPYILMLAGVFYIANGVDTERIVSDNDYAMNIVTRLNGFLRSMGVENSRAAELKAQLQKGGVGIKQSFDNLGLFIISADESTAEALYSDSLVDFVLAGGRVPLSMKDMNFDGKSDSKDAEYIQKYLVGVDVYSGDELEYVKYACDTNKDKKQNIGDVSFILKTEKK